jgi:hypothetical protein
MVGRIEMPDGWYGAALIIGPLARKTGLTRRKIMHLSGNWHFGHRDNLAPGSAAVRPAGGRG